MGHVERRSLDRHRISGMKITSVKLPQLAMDLTRVPALLHARSMCSDINFLHNKLDMHYVPCIYYHMYY
jgi:hypothetical protein